MHIHLFCLNYFIIMAKATKKAAKKAAPKKAAKKAAPKKAAAPKKS